MKLLRIPRPLCPPLPRWNRGRGGRVFSYTHSPQPSFGFAQDRPRPQGRGGADPLWNHAGFTLLELLLVLAVGGLVVGGLLPILSAQIRVPTRIASGLTASHQIQQAVQLITEDASRARSFTLGAQPVYGTFSWFEFEAAKTIPVTVQYLWSNGEVFRVHTRDGAALPQQVVIQGVRAFNDVGFQYTAPQWTYSAVSRTWGYTEGKVEVTVKTTRESGAESPDIVFNARLSADFRPQAELPAPLPGRLLPPPPPANQVNFLVSGNPTILQGNFESGSGSALRFDDISYVVVSATGSPRTAAWEASSETVSYTSITDITAQLVAQSDKAGVSVQLFIFNPNDHPGGYDTVPDASTTLTSANTDVTLLVPFGQSDIDYVNSLGSKNIKVKVVATYTSGFDLRGDQLLFKVAGQPTSTFSRDYIVEADPTLEVGQYKAGNFLSLLTDDSDRYGVEESGDVVQWFATSEPFYLDTISSIEVIFRARVTKGKPVQQIFVYNPAKAGGFGTTPDSQYTYSSTNTEVTVSFFLSAADLDYVRSLFPKVVTIRVKGTDSTNDWRLEADLVVFRVKP